MRTRLRTCSHSGCSQCRHRSSRSTTCKPISLPTSREGAVHRRPPGQLPGASSSTATSPWWVANNGTLDRRRCTTATAWRGRSSSASPDRRTGSCSTAAPASWCTAAPRPGRPGSSSRRRIGKIAGWNPAVPQADAGRRRARQSAAAPSTRAWPSRRSRREPFSTPPTSTTAPSTCSTLVHPGRLVHRRPAAARLCAVRHPGHRRRSSTSRSRGRTRRGTTTFPARAAGSSTRSTRAAPSSSGSPRAGSLRLAVGHRAGARRRSAHSRAIC